MRINVYAEELTTETEVVTKTVTDDEFGERVFYGIRVFLKSPDALHHSEEDDDRSAITFWLRWGRRDVAEDRGGITDTAMFTTLLHEMGINVNEVIRAERERVEGEARLAREATGRKL